MFLRRYTPFDCWPELSANFGRGTSTPYITRDGFHLAGSVLLYVVMIKGETKSLLMHWSGAVVQHRDGHFLDVGLVV